MITTLTGENEVERATELHRMIAVFEKTHGDMAVERLDGEEAAYDRMAEAAQSLPFLAAKKLVVLRAPSLNKEFAEKFEEFAKTISETNDILIVEPKLDKRLSYYKQLKKLTDFKEFVVLDSPKLEQYAVAYAQRQGGSLSRSDARMLIERVGTNQLAVTQEIDKLISFNPKIDKQSIELLTEKNPQSTVFELLDAAFAGKTDLAMRLYDEQRALKVEPQQIVAMLAWQLHVLALVKTAKDRSVEDIAREAKLNPFVVRKSQNLVGRVTLAELKRWVSLLREFDVRMKSEGVIPDDVVRYFLMQLAD